MAKASGVLLYFVPNRGRINLTGGGFLADARKQGHVLVASGWQGDIEPAEGIGDAVGAGRQEPGWLQHHRARARPLQRHARGRDDFADSSRRRCRDRRSGQPRYFQSHTDSPELRKTARSSLCAAPTGRSPIAAKTPFPGKPDPRKVCLKGGFNPAYLYELVYTAKDPKVYGIGFAATRDLNSYLRYGAQDDTGAANPLRGRDHARRSARAIRSPEISSAASFIWASIRMKPDESSSTAAIRISPFASWR